MKSGFKRFARLATAVLGALGVVFAFNVSPIRAAVTINVPADYPTIQAAVNAASAGDTIVVAAGTYSEFVLVNKSLTLQGAQAGVDGRNVLRTGLPATESVVNGTSGSTSFHVTASDVEIDGFTVEGASNLNVGAGIFINPTTVAGTHLVNNIIQNNIVGLFVANNSALNPAVIEKNLFRNNTLPGAASGHGIYADQSTAGVGGVNGVSIDNNKFANDVLTVASWAVGMSNTNATQFSNLTITNNEVVNHGRGMYFYFTKDSIIQGNSIMATTNYPVGLFAGNTGIQVLKNNLKDGNNGVLVDLDFPTANANIVVNRNDLSGIMIDGLFVGSGSHVGDVDGTCNWWGDPSGPSGSGPGTGSSVTADVDFSPWLLSSNLDGPCTEETTILSVNMTPSTGTTGTNVTVSSEASDQNGLAWVYYNLFTPGGALVCNIAFAPIPGNPTSYSHSVAVSAPMPFAGLNTGAGAPCPPGGITPGSYVLTANWIDGLGNQVGAPNNQLLSSYPTEAQFSPVIYQLANGTLKVTKTVNWGYKKKNYYQKFEICLTGGPTTVPCQMVGYNGGVVTFSNLAPGNYTVTETDPGASWLVTIAGSPVAVTSGNTATATVTNTVANPSISLDKQGPTLVKHGDSAPFKYLVKNTGNVPLSNIVVTDNKCTSPAYVSGDSGPATLDVGETWTYTCSYVIPVFTPTHSLTNKATATGKYKTTTVWKSDTYTLHPFTLNKVVYKLSGKRRITQADTTSFLVKVYKYGVQVGGPFSISQSSPLKVWLGSGTFKFTEVAPIPSGYTPDGSVTISTSGDDHWDDDHGHHERDDCAFGTLWNKKN